MKLALFGQFFYPDSGKYILQLVEVLQERGDEIWFEKSYFQLIQKEEILDIKNPNIFENLDRSYDFFFSIVGDGTILSAIKYVDRKSTRLNSSHNASSRMPSSA